MTRSTHRRTRSGLSSCPDTGAGTQARRGHRRGNPRGCPVRPQPFTNTPTVILRSAASYHCEPSEAIWWWGCHSETRRVEESKAISSTTLLVLPAQAGNQGHRGQLCRTLLKVTQTHSKLRQMLRNGNTHDGKMRHESRYRFPVTIGGLSNGTCQAMARKVRIPVSTRHCSYRLWHVPQPPY